MRGKGNYVASSNRGIEILDISNYTVNAITKAEDGIEVDLKILEVYTS